MRSLQNRTFKVGEPRDLTARILMSNFGVTVTYMITRRTLSLRVASKCLHQQNRLTCSLNMARHMQMIIIIARTLSLASLHERFTEYFRSRDDFWILDVLTLGTFYLPTRLGALSEQFQSIDDTKAAMPFLPHCCSLSPPKSKRPVQQKPCVNISSLLKHSSELHTLPPLSIKARTAELSDRLLLQKQRTFHLLNGSALGFR